MAVALIGLGRMGGGMVKRLTAANIETIGVDKSADARRSAAAAGATVTATLEDMVTLLPARRIVWVMLPAGAPTRDTVRRLAVLLEPGDVVVDGGNSNFRDAPGHSHALAAAGIDFVDVGVSGGQEGFRHGYGLMAGGEESTVRHLSPVFEALAAPGAFSRVGAVGSGHLVKAIHNGVQYAILQAYAEGFSLLEASEQLDTVAAMRAWQGGSSIRSWLLEQIVVALEANPTLEGAPTHIPDSGMGRWTAEEAIRLAVPTPILTAALHARFSSRSDGAGNRLLTAARDQIGGKG